jgi:hypothetical protein
MQLDLLGTGEPSRTIGAAVVRAGTNGGVVLDLGPADGPPHFRLLLSQAEAIQLGRIVQEVANEGGESVLIVEN